jgi:hypothetical protein
MDRGPAIRGGETAECQPGICSICLNGLWHGCVEMSRGARCYPRFSLSSSSASCSGRSASAELVGTVTVKTRLKGHVVAFPSSPSSRPSTCAISRLLAASVRIQSRTASPRSRSRAAVIVCEYAAHTQLRRPRNHNSQPASAAPSGRPPVRRRDSYPRNHERRE